MKRIVFNIRLTNYCGFNCPKCFVHGTDPKTFVDEDKLINFIHRVIQNDKYDMVVYTLLGGELAHLPIENTISVIERLKHISDNPTYIKFLSTGDFRDKRDDWFDLYDELYSFNKRVNNSPLWGGILHFGAFTISPYTLNNNVVSTIRDMGHRYGYVRLRFIYSKDNNEQKLDGMLKKLNLGIPFNVAVTREFDFSADRIVDAEVDDDVYAKLGQVVEYYGGTISKRFHIDGSKCKYSRDKVYVTVHTTGHITPCPLLIDDVALNKHLKYPAPHMDDVQSVDDIVNSDLYNWWYETLNEFKDVEGCPLTLKWNGTP